MAAGAAALAATALVPGYSNANAFTLLNTDWAARAADDSDVAAARRPIIRRGAKRVMEKEGGFSVYKVRVGEDVILAPLSLREALADIGSADVDAIFLGEHHFSLVDHELQARIVEALRDRLPHGRPMAVGLEMFQQRHQPVLDAYVAGRIDELDLYSQTDWDSNWVWPFENMLPVFRAARRLSVPLVALSVDSDVLAKIKNGGGMAEAAKVFGGATFERLSTPDSGFQAYVNANIVRSFAAHARAGVLRGKPSFSAFYETRIFRDEAMAACAEQYLAEHPGALLVSILGIDHMKFGTWGVPGRVKRRQADRVAALLAEEARKAEAEGTAGPLIHVDRPRFNIKTVVLNPTAADAYNEDNGALMLDLHVPGSEPVPISDMLWFSSHVDASPKQSPRRSYWRTKRWAGLPAVEELVNGQ